MVRSVLALVALVVFAPDAFAAGKKSLFGSRSSSSSPSGPPSSGYSKYPVVEGHASALSRSWKKAEEDWDKDYATLNGSLKSYESSLANAKRAESEAAAALAKSQAAFGEAQANLNQLNLRISDLDTAWLNKKVSAEERDKQMRDIEDSKRKGLARVEELRVESENLKAQLGSAQSAVASVQGQIQTHMKKVYDQDLDVKGMKEGDLRASVARLGETVLKDRKGAHVQRITDELFDSVRDDYLKSGFLVSDLNTLRDKYGFAGERLESLKRSMEKHLNDTLLGNYIHDQIKKALAKSCSDAKYQAACAAGNAPQINEILDGILPASSANRAVSGAAVKPVAPVKDESPKTGVFPNSAGVGQAK